MRNKNNYTFLTLNEFAYLILFYGIDSAILFYNFIVLISESLGIKELIYIYNLLYKILLLTRLQHPRRHLNKQQKFGHLIDNNRMPQPAFSFLQIKLSNKLTLTYITINDNTEIKQVI